MEELWKDVVGYENLYQVSNLGNVKSLNNWHKHKNGSPYLRNQVRCSTYLAVGLTKNTKRTQFQIHALVAMAFIPNPNNYPEVNHIDGIKSNNQVENLEWCTRSMNIRHAFDTKLNIAARGVKNGSSKLSNDDIKLIRDMSIPGISKNEIVNKLHVALSTVYRVLNGTTWSHV